MIQKLLLYFVSNDDLGEFITVNNMRNKQPYGKELVMYCDKDRDFTSLN